MDAQTLNIRRINHIQITVPKGAEAEARAFYCGVLGLREIAKPASLAGRGGLWLEIGDQQVHIGTEDGFDRLTTKAHIAYEVDRHSLLEGAAGGTRRGHRGLGADPRLRPLRNTRSVRQPHRIYRTAGGCSDDDLDIPLKTAGRLASRGRKAARSATTSRSRAARGSRWNATACAPRMPSPASFMVGRITPASSPTSRPRASPTTR